MKIIAVCIGIKWNSMKKVACRMGYIDSRQITKLAEPMVNNGYGEYLLRLAEEKDKT